MKVNHHSKPLSHSLLLCLLPQTNETSPDKRNYLLEATPISSANQPMAEQADQQWPVWKKPSDRRKAVHSEGVICQWHIKKKTLQDTSKQETWRPIARPRCLADRAHHRSSRHTASSPRPTTAPATSCLGSPWPSPHKPSRTSRGTPVVASSIPPLTCGQLTA